MTTSRHFSAPQNGSHPRFPRGRETGASASGAQHTRIFHEDTCHDDTPDKNSRESKKTRPPYTGLSTRLTLTAPCDGRRSSAEVITARAVPHELQVGMLVRRAGGPCVPVNTICTSQQQRSPSSRPPCLTKGIPPLAPRSLAPTQQTRTIAPVAEIRDNCAREVRKIA